MIYICIRGIQTDAKLRSLTRIDLNVMHLVNLCKNFCQKMQIRGSGDLQNLVYSTMAWLLGAYLQKMFFVSLLVYENRL